MSTPSPDTGHDHQSTGPGAASEGHAGHGGHRWMMIACCIPMVLVVGALVASGVAGAGAIMFAVVCVGMMALMMFAMPGDKH